MSNDNGDNNTNSGWWDDLQEEWNQDQLVYETHNPDAPGGWEHWESHDLEGSHWQTEPVYYDTMDDAINAIEHMRESPGDYLSSGTTAGEFADINIYYNSELDQYYTIGDVYVVYP